MGNIIVDLDPEERQQEVDRLLKRDGLSHVEENPKGVYCPISLTITPNILKPVFEARQNQLKVSLENTGLKAYNPGDKNNPFNPDRDLSALPYAVYLKDSGEVASARYTIGHNLFPSSGQGVEFEKAKFLHRVIISLMDNNIRVSRMQPHRTIYLAYNNFKEQQTDFEKVFTFMQNFEPGVGFDDQLPVLLGFSKTGNEIVNLEKTIYEEFPHLKYNFDNSKSIPDLTVKNPEIFYEFRKDK